MPQKKQISVKKHKELSAKELSYEIKFVPPKTKSSDSISPCLEIIGQENAINSIKLGLNVKSNGYNIFVTGPVGTGRTSTIQHLLEQLDHNEPHLKDICYVHNFKNEDAPKILIYKAGEGTRFKKDMGYLISSVRKAIPKIFISEDFKDRQNRITREFEGRQKEIINNFEERLTETGFVMVQIQVGPGIRNEIQPLIDDEPASLEKLERLSKEGKFSPSRLEELGRTWDSLRREFDVVTSESKKLSDKLDDALTKLELTIVSPLVMDKINLLKKRYPIEKVLIYLDEVEEALLEDLDRFREAQPRRGEEEPPPHRKREPFEEFSVNVILDNSTTEEIPIISEKSPSYKNMFGSVERVVDRFGYWRTDFSRIFSGSLLKASGGFYIIDALDLLSEQGMWMQLKRALRNQEIQIAGYDPLTMMAGSGIKPEPIPLDVKVVLIGEPHIYNLLMRMDPDFKKVFKVKAEFDSSMKATNANFNNYYQFIKRVILDEQLKTFDISGLQAVTEFGMKLSGTRKKITTQFTHIADIVREADYCATHKKRKIVTRDDVHCAIANQRSRVNLIEGKVQEMFDNDSIMVSVSGKTVGQINGLSVYSLGEHSFGRPTRITVNTSLGKEGVINIERESDLSGPTHNKGVLILSGYLRMMFAQDKPLAMVASISFEQSYSGVDGDSASSTEIYAILSSLGNLPIQQGIAVTGSVNQKGEIQPIGGVNYKIEGYFDVCKSKRLTGNQGVMIPHQNVNELMLRPDVIEAVKQKKFHIYPVKTIADGIEILTGVAGGKRLRGGKFTQGSVMQIVDDKLRQMALDLQFFGRTNNNNK